MKNSLSRAAKKQRRTISVDAPSGVPREGFATLEAATLAGAAGGVAAGAIAGPPGAIVGGIIGTAVGMMAGSTLDVVERRTDAHDRELDDAIGVTDGDLGAREMAIAGLREAERTGGGPLLVEGDPMPVAERLRAEHAHLEQVYADLVRAYRNGDWNDVRASFGTFEAELRAHMATEEEHAVAAFRAVSPDDARELLAEHEELRRMLEVFGVNIELHAVPSADIEAFVGRLRAHSEHEERVLYPWIEATFMGGPAR